MTETASFTSQATAFLTKWTPRAAAVAIGGYYGLGIAYDLGLLALIDQIAIQVLKTSFGYVGIGAIMPSFQWYAGWAVRIGIGLGVGLLYDLAEKCILASWAHFSENQPIFA
jgi:hypothetical protein